MLTPDYDGARLGAENTGAKPGSQQGVFNVLNALLPLISKNLVVRSGASDRRYSYLTFRIGEASCLS
jgi:hypothetical protein